MREGEVAKGEVREEEVREGEGAEGEVREEAVREGEGAKGGVREAFHYCRRVVVGGGCGEGGPRCSVSPQLPSTTLAGEGEGEG